MKKNVCMNCGNDTFFEGFMSNEKGPIYYSKGKPTLKKQLFGKKKAMHLRICKNCGNALIFCSLK